MKENLNYVPKKRKVNYFLVVLLLFVMGFGFYFFFETYFVDDNDDLYYTFCDLSPKETQKILSQQEKNYDKQSTINFNDYGIYGESLTLYADKYSRTNTDSLSGDTLFLKNLCATSLDDESPYLLSSNLDIGIELSQLEEGLYEVDILSDFEYKRLRSDVVFDEIFYTAKRDGVIKKIRVFTDNDILNENLDKQIIKDQYLFIEVTHIEDNDEIDVVLNPSGFTIFENGQIDFGHIENSYNEADETYRLALAVKEKLTDKGIRVEILRNDSQPVNNFGENGRVELAYDFKAKYMVNMRLSRSYSQYDYGISVLYSNFASNRFASIMASELLDNTKLQESYYTDRNNPPSVFQTELDNNLDYNNIIRETGGKLLGAGTLKEFKDMASFSDDKNIGINTIDVLYGYMNDKNDFDAWQKDFDKIAESTAQAILKTMGSD